MPSNTPTCRDVAPIKLFTALIVNAELDSEADTCAGLNEVNEKLSPSRSVSVAIKLWIGDCYTAL